MWTKTKEFFKSLWLELKDWKTLILFILVFLTLSIPIWVGYGLYWIFKIKWCLAMATSYLLFWNIIPGTPFIGICIAITLGIKKLINRRKTKCTTSQ